jgi:hypothetical protein
MTTEREQKQYKLNNSKLMDLLSTLKDESSLDKVNIKQAMELPPLNSNDHSQLSSSN